MGRMVQYGALAKYYDRIYSFKDYETEAVRLAKIIHKYGQSGGNKLLDIGCGTGRHISYLKHDFKCIGADASADMLRVARKNVRGVKFVRADMEHIKMRMRFDAILILFSAIGYVKTYGRLKHVLENCHTLLKPGGILIIDGWSTPEQWKTGSVHMRTYESGGTKIARVGFSRTRHGVSVLEECYLIAERGKGIRSYIDIQELGLFKRQRFLSTMRDVGFEAMLFKRTAGRRDQYIGIKPAAKP